MYLKGWTWNELKVHNDGAGVNWQLLICTWTAQLKRDYCHLLAHTTTTVTTTVTTTIIVVIVRCCCCRSWWRSCSWWNSCNSRVKWQYSLITRSSCAVTLSVSHNSLSLSLPQSSCQHYNLPVFSIQEAVVTGPLFKQNTVFIPWNFYDVTCVKCVTHPGPRPWLKCLIFAGLARRRAVSLKERHWDFRVSSVFSDGDRQRPEAGEEETPSSDGAVTEQFESTGLFHWCDNRTFESAVLVSSTLYLYCNSL